LKFKE